MTGRIIGAVIAIIIGVILVLSNYGLLPENFDILRLWPLLLIVWGGWVLLATARRKKNQ